MPLVKAQCENCSGILTVDSSKKAAICPYCGTPYVVQDAINHYSTHIENLHADVVNIQNGESKQDLLKNAETFYRLGQFDRAKKAYEIVIERYPNEPQGWWGAYKTVLSSFSYFHELNDAYKQYGSVAMKLHDYSDEYRALWNALVKEYSTQLHFSDSADCVWNSLSRKDIELILYADIHKTNNPYLKQLQNAVSNSYYHAFKSGTTSFFTFDTFGYGMVRLLTEGVCTWNPYSSYEECRLENIPVLQRIIDEGCQNALELFPDNRFRTMEFLRDHIQYASSSWKAWNIPNPWAKCIQHEKKQLMIDQAKWIRWDIPYRVVFFLGKTIILERIELDYEYKPPETSHFQILITKDCLSPQDIKKMKVTIWKKENRCAHCGGNLTRGFFSTKCEHCGKKKDY